MIRKLLCFLGFHKWETQLKPSWKKLLDISEKTGRPISTMGAFMYEERCKYCRRKK